jgi:hypothetical protein
VQFSDRIRPAEDESRGTGVPIFFTPSSLRPTELFGPITPSREALGHAS